MFSTIRRLAILTLATALFALPAVPQQGLIYSATVIPSIAVSGGSVNVQIQIVSFTTDAEKSALKEVFASGASEKGIAMLRTFSHGFINISGQPGRKIYAAFSFQNPNGTRLVLVTDHVLSEYEKTQGANATDYPLTIIRMKFDPTGHPVSGEVIPAAKITVTKDGFVDMPTEYPTTATMINISRVN